MPIGTIVKDYSKLLESIQAGAEEYNKKRARGDWWLDYPDAGFFHLGVKGINKGKKALAYAEKIQNLREESGRDRWILLLAIALFTSSSNWLTTEIALKMIEGERFYTVSLVDHTTVDSPTCSLRSSVFSIWQLEGVTASYYTAIDGTTASFSYHKRKNAESLLRAELNELFPPSLPHRIAFDKDVEALKASLRDGTDQIDDALVAVELSTYAP